MAEFRTLALTSPHMRGPDVKHAQHLLKHNRFDENYRPGEEDGDFGESSRDGTKRAKFATGYPRKKVNGNFGPKLHSFLIPKTAKGAKYLPPTYLFRRRARKKQIQSQLNGTIKARALEIAESEAAKHIVESPFGSNSNPYGRWYGLNRVPWCAIFITYCMVMAGDKKICKRGACSAYAYWFEQISYSHPLLSITNNPEPGDIVVYHHGQGHVEFFRRWTNRAAGQFESVGGNTSTSGSQDNGGAVLIRHRDTGWARTVFVRVEE